MWICTALSRNNSPSKSLRYDTCYTRVYLPPNTSHTCLITPQPQSITALWLVLITPSRGGMARLS